VVELVKAGIDVKACREYLVTNAPAFVTLFDHAVKSATEEEE
jgi:hypothetical protein